MVLCMYPMKRNHINANTAIQKMRYDVRSKQHRTLECVSIPSSQLISDMYHRYFQMESRCNSGAFSSLFGISNNPYNKALKNKSSFPQTSYPLTTKEEQILPSSERHREYPEFSFREVSNMSSRCRAL